MGGKKIFFFLVRISYFITNWLRDWRPVELYRHESVAHFFCFFFYSKRRRRHLMCLIDYKCERNACAFKCEYKCFFTTLRIDISIV